MIQFGASLYTWGRTHARELAAGFATLVIATLSVAWAQDGEQYRCARWVELAQDGRDFVAISPERCERMGCHGLEGKVVARVDGRLIARVGKLRETLELVPASDSGDLNGEDLNGYVYVGRRLSFAMGPSGGEPRLMIEQGGEQAALECARVR
jgi:hypothetical protein